jgi:DNA-binding response OmpR family regulator
VDTTTTTIAGRILIADDEQTFLESTADLLRRDGLQVDCAADAPSAAALLRTGNYDLLIADINMPGNPELELIGEVRRMAVGLPVILVTGYPSTKTAIQAVQLAVVSYLVKPFEFSALRELVQTSRQRFAIYRSIGAAQERLRSWLSELQSTQEIAASPERIPVNVVSEHYVGTMLHNTLQSLHALQDLFASLGGAPARPDGDNGQSRAEVLMHALRESIQVLERTKGSFKSRELKLLREKLEQVVREQAGPRDGPLQTR